MKITSHAEALKHLEAYVAKHGRTTATDSLYALYTKQLEPEHTRTTHLDQLIGKTTR